MDDITVIVGRVVEMEDSPDRRWFDCIKLKYNVTGFAINVSKYDELCWMIKTRDLIQSNWIWL